MPAAYAHYRFGKEVLAALPRGEQELIQAQRQLYDIGLHGPDILFYYRPLGANAVTQLGNRLHTWSGRDCFSMLWQRLEERGDSPAHRAFLYGFLCHYALDSACHGYINQMHRDSGFSHSQLETELDRYFMLADGRDPMRHKPTGHLHPTEENARVIGDFFPQLTLQQLRESLRTMVLIENLWVASNPLKRGLVLAAVRAVGKYDYATGLMRPYQAPVGCVGLLAPALGMYQQAIPRAVDYILRFSGPIERTPEYTENFKLPFDPQTAQEAPI